MLQLQQAQRFIQKNQRTIMIGLVVVVVLGGLYWWMNPRREGFYDQESEMEGEMESEMESEMEGESGSMRHLFLFYDPQCGHCKQLMEGPQSTWRRFLARHGRRADLEISEVNCRENEALAQKYNIQAIPTILMETPQGIVPFEGSRTVEALEGFIEKTY